MTPKKKNEKLSMSTRCGYSLFLLIFAAITIFLGLNALNQVESIDLPEIFAIVPLGMGVIAILLAICILAGIYTPRGGRYAIVHYR